MSGFTQATRQAILNHIFGKAAMTQPAAIHVGLLDAGKAEPTEPSYARKVTTPADWAAATAANPAVTANTTVLEFVEATEDWFGGANAVYGALYDPAGNLLAIGTLPVAKPILAGDIARYAAGVIQTKFLGD